MFFHATVEENFCGWKFREAFRVVVGALKENQRSVKHRKKVAMSIQLDCQLHTLPITRILEHILQDFKTYRFLYAGFYFIRTETCHAIASTINPRVTNCSDACHSSLTNQSPMFSLTTFLIIFRATLLARPTKKSYHLTPRQDDLHLLLTPTKCGSVQLTYHLISN